MTEVFKPTDEQQRIIALNEGSYLVVAPPGSGKTQVLTQRIARLLRESSEQRFRILALTFTTKAADNMLSRIEELVASEWRRVTAKTFHAFCLDVLQHYGDVVGVGSGFSVYENQDDRLEALARGLSDDGLLLNRNDHEVKSLRRLLAEIARLKRELVPAVAVPRTPSEEVAPLDVAYAAYDRTLRLYNAVDFDDLLGLTYRIFTEHPRVARHYRRLFRFILVDEGQDTSLAQYAVLRSLCGDEHRNVMLVADGNQFIYRFAGASDRFLKAFLDDFAATEVPLHLNFRCAEDVVNAANALISHNKSRVAIADEMQSETKAKGHITAASYANEEAEARHVVDFVDELLNHGLQPEWLNPTENPSVSPEKICILARNRFQLLNVLTELERRSIACAFATGELGLFDSALFKAAYYALRVASNPKDLLSRRNLLAVIGADSTVDPALLDEPIAEFLSTAARHSVDAAGSLIAFLATAWSQRTTDDIFVRLLLEQASKLAAAAKTDELRAVEEADFAIVSERVAAQRRLSEDGDVTIQGLLGDLSLVRRTSREKPGVRVLTIHAAKGLEFTAVALVGMNEGSFPDFRSVGSVADIDDERRNAYVAVTRAARRLHLTRPRVRTMPWGDVKPQIISRFITQMNIQMTDE